MSDEAIQAVTESLKFNNKPASHVSHAALKTLWHYAAIIAKRMPEGEDKNTLLQGMRVTAEIVVEGIK